MQAIIRGYFSFTQTFSFSVSKRDFVRKLHTHIVPLPNKASQSENVLVESIDFFWADSSKKHIEIRSNSYSIHARARLEVEGDDDQVNIVVTVLPDLIFVIFISFFFIVLLGVLVGAYWNRLPIIAAGGLIPFVLLFVFVFMQIRKGMKRMKETLVREIYNVVKYI